MKQNLYFLLFSCLFITILFVSENSRANHVAGGDMHIECIGNDSFHVRLSVYRDCAGISSLPSTQSLYWLGLNDNSNDNIVLNRTKFKDVTPVCNSQCTTCESSCSYQFGIEEHIYEGIVDLSNDNSDEYQFWFSLCCHSGNQPYRLETYFNTGVSGCPSTPEYTIPPLTIQCKDEPVHYNQGILAPDSDSLVFSLVAPRQGGGTQGTDYSYPPGYSAIEPLEYLGKNFPNGNMLPFPYGFHFNQSNGNIDYTPISQMQTFMGFGVNQYRGDTLISTTQRDFKVVVIDCQQSMPDLTYPPVINVCEDSSLAFQVSISDYDTLQQQSSVFLNWSVPEALNEATFTPDSGLSNATSDFSWDTKEGDAGSYLVYLHGRNDGCPEPAHKARAITINVKPRPRAAIQTALKSCGHVDFSASLLNVNTASITWEGEGGFNQTGDSVSHVFDAPGMYPFSVTLEFEGCETTYYDTVTVPETVFFKVDAGNDIAVCEDEEFTITPVAENAFGAVTYQWSTGSAGSGSMTFSLSNSTEIVVTAYDEEGCYSYDTVMVDVSPKPAPDLTDGLRFCDGESVETGSGFPDTYHHAWIYLDENSSMGNDTSIVINQAGSYMLELTDNSAQACKAYDTISVNKDPVPAASFTFENQCENEQTTFTNTSSIDSGSITEYAWDFGNGDTSSAFSPEFSYSSAGTYNVSLKVTSDANCTDINSMEVEIFETPQPDFSISSGCAADTLQFNNLTTFSQGSEVLNYQWHFGMNNDASTAFEPTYSYTTPGMYNVSLKVTSPEGCVSSVNKMVEIYEKPTAGFEVSDTCAGSKLEMKNNSAGTNLSYNWEFGDGNQASGHEPSHTFNDPGTYEISLTITDNNGCTDQHHKEVTIFELPDASFTYNKSGGMISVSPNDLTFASYEWDFGDGNSSNYLTTAYEYSSNGTYDLTLKVTNSEGCVDESSKTLNITGVSLISTHRNSFRTEIHPNPFSGETVITYELPENGDVHIALYDLTGRTVTLIDRAYKTAGEHSTVLNAQDAGIASGVYILRLQAGDGQAIKRIVNTE